MLSDSYISSYLFRFKPIKRSGKYRGFYLQNWADTLLYPFLLFFFSLFCAPIFVNNKKLRICSILYFLEHILFSVLLAKTTVWRCFFTRLFFCDRLIFEKYETLFVFVLHVELDPRNTIKKGFESIQLTWHACYGTRFKPNIKSFRFLRWDKIHNILKGILFKSGFGY